jgi:hypothetical protein
MSRRPKNKSRDQPLPPTTEGEGSIRVCKQRFSATVMAAYKTRRSLIDYWGRPKLVQFTRRFKQIQWKRPKCIQLASRNEC